MSINMSLIMFSLLRAAPKLFVDTINLTLTIQQINLASTIQSTETDVAKFVANIYLAVAIPASAIAVGLRLNNFEMMTNTASALPY